MDDDRFAITCTQEKILEKFKYNLRDVLTPSYTDKILIKYLRARNFNLMYAERIFRENFYNRLLARVSTLVDSYEKPEVVTKYEATGVLGFAKDGTLIRYMPYGRFDCYGAIMSMSTFDMCLYMTYMMDCDLKTMKEQSLKTGKEITEVTYIVDLEGFSIQQVLHKCVIEIALDFVRLLQDCYPEVWNIILIVNAPYIFDKAFNLFKPVMHSHILERIKLTRKENTTALLLEYIDEDVLPVFLGGKRVDSNGDPQCREFLTFGGTIPEKLYDRNRRVPLSPTDPGVTCVTIGPRSCYNIILVLKEGATNIRMQHRFENGSLSVIVLHKEVDSTSSSLVLPEVDEYIDPYDENNKFKQISVTLRAQGHCCEEDALVFLKWPGIYVLSYRNLGSWFSSRKLIAKYSIMPKTSENTL